jgi:DedD protein
MEARAKQRLTGAIILVALFVLLVPELLTGPHDPHQPTENVNDDGLHRYTIDLDAQNGANAPAASAQSQPAVSLPAVPSTSNSALAAPGETTSPTVATPKPPAASVPTTTNPSTPAPTSNHVAATVPSPAASPVVAPPRNPAPPRTESARSPPAEPAAKGPATSGSFVVQLGTFGKRENADRLVRDMTTKGFSAFVVPTNTNGHELFRVRVGPARDRAAAEALAEQLKRAGQSGSIVPIS